MNRRGGIVLVVLAVAVLLVTGTVIRAQGGAQVRACASCDPPQGGGGGLPVIKGPMSTTSVGEALVLLSFDDGTCESGLGAGTTMAVTDYVEFDVPTACTTGAVGVVAVTTRLNTGMTVGEFAFGQAGTAAPPYLAGAFQPITGIPPFGPCPATALTSRPVVPAAIITGTSNFFAGVRAAGFVGRDSNGPPAGRIWLDCGFCGMTQYTPTDLSGLGLGGNWMIRVTVEDCIIPVELIGFDVS